MTTNCTKCGSDKIISRAKIFDQGEYSDGTLKAAFVKNPEAWIFKGTVLSRLRAVICGACGFTELYVEEPDKLHEAFQQSANPHVRRRENAAGAARPDEPASLGGVAGDKDTCLQCDAELPIDATTCPACGWTYRGFELNS